METSLKVALIGPHAFSSVHNEPSLSFSNFLLTRGWVVTSEVDDVDVVCSIEVPVNKFNLVSIPKFPKSKALLVIQEPSVVRTQNTKVRWRKRFASVIEVGRPVTKKMYLWPALYLRDFEKYSRTIKMDKCCMISSNKMSFVNGELYSLRRLAAHANPVIDTYGHGWDSTHTSRLRQVAYEALVSLTGGSLPRLKGLARFFNHEVNTCGSVSDKLEVNSLYKVSLVIENSAEYMSEKLLEAVSAGSIPVYVGPPVEDFGIPTDLVVQVGPTRAAVLEGIERALSLDYEDWRSKCSAWISKPSTISDWSLETHWLRIEHALRGLAMANKGEGELSAAEK